MMEERRPWLTLLVKLIILRRLGEEVLLFSFIHVHPTSSDGWTARYRSNSSSVTCLAISIGWSWNKPTSCINSQSTFYTGNCFSQEFHMKLYYNYAFLWYNYIAISCIKKNLHLKILVRNLCEAQLTGKYTLNTHIIQFQNYIKILSIN